MKLSTNQILLMQFPGPFLERRADTRRDRQREIAQQVRLQLLFEQRLQRRSQRQLATELRMVAALLTERDEIISTKHLARLDRALDAEQPQWVAMLTIQYQQVLSAFGDRIFQQLGTRKDRESIFQAATENFIRRWGLDKAKKITSTTKDYVREKIVGGIREGLGNREIARLFRDQITGRGNLNPRQRAYTIAVTETHTAAVWAGDEAVEALSVKNVIREWMTVEDARTRPSHVKADRQQRAMDEPFDVGGSKLMRPGDPEGPPEETILCRCVLGYIAPE